MSLPTNARADLVHLKSEFEAKAATYPDLRHVLISTPNDKAFDEAKTTVMSVLHGNHRLIHQSLRGTVEVQAFIDDDFCRGKKAYEALCELAELAVETFATHKLIEPTDVPPDQSLPYWFEAKKNHYAKQWMRFIHQFAQAHPGALPRSVAARYLETEPLKEEGTVNTLTPGVFKASYQTIERILNSGMEQAPAGPPALPRECKQPAAVPASGGKTPEVPIPSARPKIARGRLDESAAIEVKKNPALTYGQLAAILECSASTLRKRKKYPLLAAAKAMVKAERERFRGNSTWQDRGSDNDE